MFNKLYEKIKEIFFKNKIFFITFFATLILFKIKLPYTIDMPGGYINVSNRITLENAYEQRGSFNMAYVSEINASIPMYLIALLNPEWDIVNNKDILLDNDTLENLIVRNKLALEEANNNAKLVAFKKAGYHYEIKKEKIYTAYVSEDATTDLEVGDEIVSINNVDIESREEIVETIKKYNIGDEITFKVKNNDKNYTKKATIKEIDGKKAIGIVAYDILEIETDPTVKIKNANSESGPSGGLMTSLAIYNSLIEEDITHGNTIVGTGTIDRNGNVGSIGGVKFKIMGAVKNKAKVFIIPNGENYDEAKKIIEKNKYNIKLVGVSTFDEALEFLKEYN